MSLSGNTILVPVDFEAASLAVLDTARDLGRRLGMEIVLLHVYMLPVFVYPGIDPISVPGTAAEVEAAARSATEDLAAGERWIVRNGNPAEEIIKAAEELHPTFIAMGTHGRGALSRFFLGSVADRVVRVSTAPVLVIRSQKA